jgi:hypothetical protein
MRIRNFFAIIALFLILPLSTSCVTKALWSDPSYNEVISQIFVGADGRYVVFVGDRFHYVFTDNSSLLKTVISLKQKKILSMNPERTQLKLDSDNNVSGEVVFSGPFSLLPAEDAYSLQALGFGPDYKDNISIRIKVSGRRYVAKYIGSAAPVLELPYRVKVYYSDNNLIKGVGKAAVTPISVTLDAILLIGKVALIPFGGRDVDD